MIFIYANGLILRPSLIVRLTLDKSIPKRVAVDRWPKLWFWWKLFCLICSTSTIYRAVLVFLSLVCLQEFFVVQFVLIKITDHEGYSSSSWISQIVLAILFYPRLCYVYLANVRWSTAEVNFFYDLSWRLGKFLIGRKNDHKWRRNVTQVKNESSPHKRKGCIIRSVQSWSNVREMLSK